MATSTKTVRVELTGDPSSLDRSLTVVSEKSGAVASKMEGHASRIGGAFGKLDNLLGGFGIPFTGALSTIGAQIEKLETKGASNFEKLATAGKGALLGIGAVAAIVGVESVHLADQFEEAHARLEGAIKNVGGNFKTLEPAIEAVNKKLENLGFTNTETEGSLAALTRASGSTQKALGLMGLAADLARARHISLESAVAILSKVVTGHVALLGRYGIATKDAAGNTLSVDEAVKALSDKFGGQAAQSAETFQGKVKVLEAKLTDIGIKIGTFLIPIIESLVGVISGAISWFEKHKEVAIALGIVIGTVLVAAIAAYTAAMIQAAAATIAATWPILAIIAALALIVAAAIFVWTNWNQIWNWIKDHPAYAAIIAILAAPVAAFVLIVGGLKWLYDNWDAVWSGIQQVMQIAWSSVLQPVFAAIVAAAQWVVGAAQTLWSIWQAVWSGVSSATSGAWGVISPVLGAIVGALTAVWSAAQTLWGIWQAVMGTLGSIAAGAAGVVVGALSGIIGVLGGIIGAAESAADAISSIPDIVGGAGDFVNKFNPLGGDFLGFAEGGPVPGPIGAPQLAVVHGGEFVVPSGGALVSGGGGGSTGPIVIQLVLDGRALTEAVISNVNTPGGPQIAQRAIANR